ncbi:hypothetical protein [Egicoccus sp. AB-alg6-2]|uniref:hypothetical protein n=1 Tax=Egicoccus sp. AB-alg6-2 TaxID=3242692 RepID=UPI00359DAE85
MTTVTVGSDLAVEPSAVWRRLVDVDRLVVEDHDLDLVDVEGRGDLHPGARVVVSRRHDRRLSTYDIRVLDAVPERLLALAVTAGRESWLVEARLRTHEHGTELLVTAQLDPDATPGSVIRGLARPLDIGLYHEVTELLERWVRHTTARTAMC